MNEPATEPTETATAAPSPARLGWGFWLTNLAIFILIKLAFSIGGGLVAIGLASLVWYCGRRIRAGDAGPWPVVGVVVGIVGLVILLLALAFMAIGGRQPLSSYDECVQKYVVTAGGEDAARYAQSICQQVGRGRVLSETNRCLLPKLRDVRSRFALQVAINQCARQ